MTGRRRRDRLVQEHLEGRIDESELRRRLDGEALSDELEAELTAYRVVWDALELEPPSRLPPDFGRRTARAAMRERASPTFDRVMGTAVGAGALAAVGAAAAVLGTGLQALGVDPAALLQEVAAAGGRTPPALIGSAAAAAVLWIADRIAGPRGRAIVRGR